MFGSQHSRLLRWMLLLSDLPARVTRSPPPTVFSLPTELPDQQPALLFEYRELLAFPGRALDWGLVAATRSLHAARMPTGVSAVMPSKRAKSVGVEREHIGDTVRDD